MDTPAPTAPHAAGSLQDRIRLALEAEILSGERPPGSAIDDRQLAERFQSSRTPVREALLVLAAQGLVHIAPRSGIYVRRASVDELVAGLEALTETESVIAGLAARRATAAQCEALQAAVEDTTRFAAADDRRAYDAANVRLHDIIYAASGSPVLVDMVRQVRRRLAAYRQRSTNHPGRLKASGAEHQRIVAAICAGDADRAAAEMRQHISLGGDALVQLVGAAQALAPADVPRRDAAPAPAPRTRATPKAARRNPQSR